MDITFNNWIMHCTALFLAGKELRSARAALEQERKLRKVQSDTIKVCILKCTALYHATGLYTALYSAKRFLFTP